MNYHEAAKYCHERGLTQITHKILRREVRLGRIGHTRVSHQIIELRPLHLDRWIEKKTVNA